ncbi:hypothetical protein EC609_19615 [Achromobacter denitrificans]|nr:hypothetical protein EC609_19615 [Achromobacter denitrificans]
MASDNSTLQRRRSLPAAPMRWHASVNRQDFALLYTREKFWDLRSGTCGRGAVDLTMHLLDLSFKQISRFLVEREI